MKPELQPPADLSPHYPDLSAFYAYLLSKFRSRENLHRAYPYFSILPIPIEDMYQGHLTAFFDGVIDRWKAHKRPQVIGIHGHQGTGKTDLLEKMLLDLVYRRMSQRRFSLTVLTAEDALFRAVPGHASGQYTFLDYQAGSLALTEAASVALSQGYDFVFIEAPANTGVIPGSMDRGTSTMKALGRREGDFGATSYEMYSIFLVAGTDRYRETIKQRSNASTETSSKTMTLRPGGRIESLYQADSDLARVIEEVCDADMARLPDYDYRAEVMAYQLFPFIAKEWQIDLQNVFIGENIQRPYPNQYASMVRRYSFFHQHPDLT